jgi:hypothetical protein
MALITKDKRNWASTTNKIKYKEGMEFQTGDIAIRKDGCRMIYIDEKTYLKYKDIIVSFFSSIKNADIKDGFFICVYKSSGFSYLKIQDFYDDKRFAVDIIYRNSINGLEKFLKDQDLVKTAVYELTKDWSK